MKLIQTSENIQRACLKLDRLWKKARSEVVAESDRDIFQVTWQRKVKGAEARAELGPSILSRQRKNRAFGHISFILRRKTVLPSAHNVLLLLNVLQFKWKQKQTLQFGNVRFWINDSEKMKREYKWRSSVLEFLWIKIQIFERKFPKASDYFTVTLQ